MSFCTLSSIPFLEFNIFLVLVLFIEGVLDIQYFCTGINQKVFRCVSKTYIAVHVISMDFANVVLTPVAIVLVLC